MPHCVHQRTCPIVQNENHWRARPSAGEGAKAAASYKTDDDDIKRRNGVGVGGKITSPPPLNPHLQSGQDKRGIGCLRRPDNPPSKVKSQTASNPLRRSASVGDWQRKYLFLEDPEARADGNRGGGSRASFVEQEPVTGRTFDPLAFRERGTLCQSHGGFQFLNIFSRKEAFYCT